MDSKDSGQPENLITDHRSLTTLPGVFVVGFQQAKEEGHGGRVGAGSDSILTAYCLTATTPVLSLRHSLELDIAEMTAKHLLQIERAIHQLSAKEKLWLLERIARQLREPDEAELSAMAGDPEIQAEIGLINQEFALTEMDGLQSA